jgi:hypothetical protein
MKTVFFNPNRSKRMNEKYLLFNHLTNQYDE